MCDDESTTDEDPPELEDVIREVAAGPKSVTVDGTNVQAHSIKELIEADQHLAGKSGAASTRHRGIRFSKLVPPGATS